MRYVTYLSAGYLSDEVKAVLPHDAVMHPIEHMAGRYARTYDKYGRLVAEGYTEGRFGMGYQRVYPIEKVWEREGTL